MKNSFDIVMDYIDEHIGEDSETIKKGIWLSTGYSSVEFGKFFSILTNETLFSYIRRRKLYIAFCELQSNRNKPIVDIALDYGYSEQSAFTRAMKNEYGMTPDEIRSKCTFLEDNKYYFAELTDCNERQSRIKSILQTIKKTGILFGENSAYLCEVEEGCNDFGFDFDTGCAIAEIAERLETPIYPLMEKCFELSEAAKAEGYADRERINIAVSCGIYSDEELQKICKHYDCQFYELNIMMTEKYYEEHPDELQKVIEKQKTDGAAVYEIK